MALRLFVFAEIRVKKGLKFLSLKYLPMNVLFMSTLEFGISSSFLICFFSSNLGARAEGCLPRHRCSLSAKKIMDKAGIHIRKTPKQKYRKKVFETHFLDPKKQKKNTLKTPKKSNIAIQITGWNYPFRRSVRWLATLVPRPSTAKPETLQLKETKKRSSENIRKKQHHKKRPQNLGKPD